MVTWDKREVFTFFLKKLWLIILNSPSLTANTRQDHKLKVGMIDDVFTILNIEKILTGDEE